MIKSNFTSQFDSLDTISDEAWEMPSISSRYVHMPEGNTKESVSIQVIDVVQKGKKSNHATFVIKKTGELNFIKVFPTL